MSSYASKLIPVFSPVKSASVSLALASCGRHRRRRPAGSPRAQRGVRPTLLPCRALPALPPLHCCTHKHRLRSPNTTGQMQLSLRSSEQGASTHQPASTTGGQHPPPRQRGPSLSRRRGPSRHGHSHHRRVSHSPATHHSHHHSWQRKAGGHGGQSGWLAPAPHKNAAQHCSPATSRAAAPTTIAAVITTATVTTTAVATACGEEAGKAVMGRRHHDERIALLQVMIIPQASSSAYSNRQEL